MRAPASQSAQTANLTTPPLPMSSVL
jgi:hypothetical protein